MQWWLQTICQRAQQRLLKRILSWFMLKYLQRCVTRGAVEIQTRCSCLRSCSARGPAAARTAHLTTPPIKKQQQQEQQEQQQQEQEQNILQAPQRRRWRLKPVMLVASCAAIVVTVLAVVLPVCLTGHRCRRAPKPDVISTQPTVLRLIAATRVAGMDALDALPPQVRQFVKSAKLPSSALQVGCCSEVLL